MKIYEPNHEKWYLIQFIKNHKGNFVCKSFRKYNKVEGWYSKWNNSYVHYSGTHLHFIPKEYVKILKEFD